MEFPDIGKIKPSVLDRILMVCLRNIPGDLAVEISLTSHAIFPFFHQIQPKLLWCSSMSSFCLGFSMVMYNRMKMRLSPGKIIDVLDQRKGIPSLLYTWSSYFLNNSEEDIKNLIKKMDVTPADEDQFKKIDEESKNATKLSSVEVLHLKLRETINTQHKIYLRASTDL